MEENGEADEPAPPPSEDGSTTTPQWDRKAFQGLAILAVIFGVVFFFIWHGDSSGGRYLVTTQVVSIPSESRCLRAVDRDHTALEFAICDDFDVAVCYSTSDPSFGWDRVGTNESNATCRGFYAAMQKG